MWRLALPALVLSLGCAVACGGRSERSAPDDDGLPSSQGGGRSGSGSGGNDSVNGGVTSGNGGQVALPIAGSVGLVDPCIEQLVAYGEYRHQVITEFSSFACMVDDDCLAFYDQSACDTSCFLVTTAARRGVVDRLNNFETTSCAPDCAAQPWASCPPLAQPRCVVDRCRLPPK